jgi:hypothetical protein
VSIRVSLRSLLAITALGLVVPAPRAHAQTAPSPTVAQARDAFARGAKLASEERWGDALAAFTESAELRPHATTVYNVGYCERALGHAVRARKNFGLALALDEKAGGAELTPELRAASKKYLEETRSQIAMPKLAVPKDVSITVDGRPLEALEDGRFLAGTRPQAPGEKVPSGSFSIEIDAGAHEIVITAPDGRSKVGHEYFPPGSTKEVRLELPPPAPIVVAPVYVDTGKSRRAWGYVIGGIGLVGMGIGTYFGLSARSTWSDAKDACPDRSKCDDAAVRLSSDARSEANVSTIAFVAGGAALVGGTILVLTSSPTERPRATVGAAIDPRGSAWLSLSGSF